ncbi:MAG: Tad domain-containing protein [Rhizobiales bacterium]|nr:Tad domain-containing protein [Hyphomicrobiales bacterium]
MTIRLKQLIFKFCSDNSGQVIIIFAVLLIPMAVILGGALDVAHQYNQFKKLQTSIDLANLAVAKEVGRNPSIKSAQLNKIAEIIMQANLPRSSAIDLEPFNHF